MASHVVHGAFPLARIAYRWPAKSAEPPHKGKEFMRRLGMLDEAPDGLIGLGFILGPSVDEKTGLQTIFACFFRMDGSYTQAKPAWRTLDLDPNKCVELKWEELDKLPPEHWVCLEGMYTVEVTT